LTIEYRPQSNGLVERANGEVLRHLRAIVMSRRISSEWSRHLPLVQRIINATPHTSIGTTPARVLFGDAVHLDRQLLRDNRDAQRQQGHQVAVEAYIQNLNEAQRQIVEASDRHQQAVVDKRLAGQQEDDLPFAEGDYVLVSYPGRPPNKLAPRWRGPFTVQEIRSSVCVCQDLTTLRPHRFHVSRLKRFEATMTDDPAALAAADKDEFIVEEIIDHRGNPRRRADMQFRVRWLGYGPEEDLWLPYREVRELEALDRYAATHPELRL
jgi:hypothetical protein